MQWHADSPRLGLNGDSVGAETEEREREEESQYCELYRGNILHVYASLLC